MIFNQTEKEERAYLMDIIALLAANIEQMDKAIEDKSKDVMEHKLYLWENLSELDRAEKSAVRQIVTQQVAASESLAEKKKRYRKMMAIPYFGRIDFQEKGQPEVIIRKTKCFDFWERNVLFPKTKRSFFRTPTLPFSA